MCSFYVLCYSLLRVTGTRDLKSKYTLTKLILKLFTKATTEYIDNFTEPFFCSVFVKIGTLNLFYMEPTFRYCVKCSNLEASRTTGDLERFQCINFEISFLKNENLFLKSGVLLLSWECNTSINLSKTNVKANWMGIKKWTYHKEHSFATNYFIFWKLNWSKRTVDLMHQPPKCP